MRFGIDGERGWGDGGVEPGRLPAGFNPSNLEGRIDPDYIGSDSQLDKMELPQSPTSDPRTRGVRNDGGTHDVGSPPARSALPLSWHNRPS